LLFRLGSLIMGFWWLFGCHLPSVKDIVFPICNSVVFILLFLNFLVI